MEAIVEPQLIEQWVAEAWSWLRLHVFAWSTVVQAAVVVVALGIARLAAPASRRGLRRLWAGPSYERFGRPLTRVVSPLAVPAIWLVLLWFAVFAAENAGWANRLMESVVSLLTAWVVIRLAAAAIRDPFWSRAVTAIVWSIAALNILGLLGPTLATLDSMAVTLGQVRISVLLVLKGVAVFAIVMWIASLLARLAESRFMSLPGMTPSLRVLFGKVLRILLFFIAVLIALESVGIDLTALAVFGGALGLGIGFGLQKVVSNLVSGLILLLDKSVKPGDVIAIGDTFGWINDLGARYVSVITRDGTEHLIPNEELISQRVENWSHSDQMVRQKLPIGVSYGSDVRKAMQLAEEGAGGVARVLDDPAPVCRLMAFGDDAVQIELRLWINDPQNGVVNVRSAVLLRVWDLFHEHGIEFPFSQRDLHIKHSVPLDVRLVKPDGDEAG